MTGRGGSSSNNGGGAQSIPGAARKMVQSLKEIVNCPENEIYAMLKDCNMDPNEAVNRLLSQDPFHEVKSKREKKKENKDTTESRPHGVSSTSSRGGRGGNDRYAGRGGSTSFNSSEFGGLQGKPAYKKDNGANNYTSPSSVAAGMAGNNMNRQPPGHSDPVTTEYRITELGMGDGILSFSQTSSGYQPAWSGVPGQVSMADIVKMGKLHGKASNMTKPSQYGVTNHHVQELQPNATYHDSLSSDNYVFKGSKFSNEPGVGSGQHVSSNDEWPLIEQPPATGAPPVLDPPVASELHSDTSYLSSSGMDHHPESERDEFQVVEDAAIENINADQARPASISSRKIQEDNSGSSSMFNSDIYQNMASYQPHTNAFERQEVEHSVSVSTITSNLEQLSVHEDPGAAPEEDNPSVIIPSHLQVQSADCSHLSFGSFRCGISSFSGPFSAGPERSNIDEASADADAPSVVHLDTRNLEYYGDDTRRTASDGNLVHRIVSGAGSYDSPSASQSEMLKQENSETSQEDQYAFPSSSSNYNFENGRQLDDSFPHSQTSPRIQNLAPFSSVMAHTNSLPNALLAASVQPVRESDLSYSPFPMTQSMPSKYGNTVSSIGGSSISMPEALKAAGFSSTQQTAQTLHGSNIATGPAIPQHLAVHPYSQPTLPLGPFANMISYPFLPQSYTYMPSAFQQAFAGNSPYHQSLAAVVPQYKNSVSVSSLPQSTAIASGYGGFGSSTNFPMNMPAAPGPTTIGYDDVISSQYKDNSHLISLQQNENSAMWVHGPGSRTMSAVPASTYYSFQGQSQQPSGFRQSQQQPSQSYGALGYPNFYHSQSGISLEQHQQQNPRDVPLGGSQGQQPSRQSQQIWQNSY
ncbi:uncharacterized protein LOC130779587 isoform X1 [Actinidia eriantha]|uniref:uncharacterized protein LOC130779587 isoform X1 n=1 Tax=Actinidia eriantha TaxID=165200 RepID=UPI00258723DC|nr:uncharacterized protein LOC130779587 isoform X1 [Actinidia eriantha]